MKIDTSLLATVIFLSSVCHSNEQDITIPLEDGQYQFQHKFAEAEQYKIRSINLIVKIKGNRITIINNDKFDVFPKGVLEEGLLMWHPKSQQWIIGDNPSDKELEDVGGCSEGPAVVDLKNKIYWTC